MGFIDFLYSFKISIRQMKKAFFVLFCKIGFSSVFAQSEIGLSGGFNWFNYYFLNAKKFTNEEYKSIGSFSEAMSVYYKEQGESGKNYYGFELEYRRDKENIGFSNAGISGVYNSKDEINKYLMNIYFLADKRIVNSPKFRLSINLSPFLSIQVFAKGKNENNSTSLAGSSKYTTEIKESFKFSHAGFRTGLELFVPIDAQFSFISRATCSNNIFIPSYKRIILNRFNTQFNVGLAYNFNKKIDLYKWINRK